MRNYGALFLGEETSVYGDKVIGTNHTRTQTAGRYKGGLWVGMFIKRTRTSTSRARPRWRWQLLLPALRLRELRGHKEQADVRLRHWKEGYDTKYYDGEANQTLLSRPGS